MTLHSSPFCFIYDAKFSSMLNLVTVNFCPWRNHSGSGITCPSEDKETRQLVSMAIHCRTAGAPLSA